MQQNKKVNHRKQNRELITNISFFLLSQEKLRNLFWSVKTVKYDKQKNHIKIGINTYDKLGTVLNKMRGLRRELSDYLFEAGIAIRPQPKIEFVVDREDEYIEHINKLIESVTEDSMISEVSD